jgi:hypothetical protein
MYTYVRQNPWTHFDPEGLLNWGALSFSGFIHDVGHELGANLAGMAHGFVDSGMATGQAIVKMTVGAATATSHAAQAVVNGQLSQAVSNIAQAGVSKTLSVVGQDIKSGVQNVAASVVASAHQFAQTACQSGGVGKIIGGAIPMLLGAVSGEASVASTATKIETSASKIADAKPAAPNTPAPKPPP